MTPSAVLLLLFLLAIGALSVTTLVVAARGGRGPADPPRSHPRLDPSGFPVPHAPRGALHGRGPLTRPQPRRASLPAAARAAAASHTARERRTARPTSLLSGARPSPSTGRSSTRLP